MAPARRGGEAALAAPAVGAERARQRTICDVSASRSITITRDRRDDRCQNEEKENRYLHLDE
jgi:hypothetical protein